MRLTAHALGSGILLVQVATAPTARAETPCEPPADCPDTNSEARSGADETHWTVAVPEGYHVETRSYPELAIAGAVTFGVGWIGAIAMTAATVDGADRGEAVGHSVVPVAGPIIAMSRDYDTSSIDPFLVIASAVQGFGLLGAFVGATIDSRILVPDVTEAEGKAAVELSPTPGGFRARIIF